MVPMMRECPQPPSERDWVGQAVIVAGWMYGGALLLAVVGALSLAVVVLHAVVAW